LRDPGGFFEGHISRLAEKAGSDKAGSFEAHVKNEYSTLDWIMDGLIRRAGFRVARSEYRGGFLAAYSCVRDGRSTR
jgi:hypothetical protein